MSKVNNEVNMEKDLVRGKKGEKFILKFLSEAFTITDTRKNDLVNSETGVKVEVKTESYSHERIGVEQYSSKQAKTVGGPYKAERDGCKYILHVFQKTNKVVIFETDKMLQALGSPEFLDRKISSVPNHRTFSKENNYDPYGNLLTKPYTTTGFAIPLTFFPKDCYVILDLKDGLVLDEYLK